jgi:hypothetical protein
MAKPTRFAPALVLSIAGAMAAATTAFAGPITYTVQATGMGCFGSGVTKTGSMVVCPTGTTFNDALVTITFSGNTANVTNPSAGIFENVPAPGTVTVAVAGLGSATFSDSVGAFVAQSSQAGGFADFTLSLDPLDTSNPAFATYDLKSAIGPLSGSPAFASPNEVFPVSIGGFAFTALPAGSTFTATTTVIPEPRIGWEFPIILAGGGVLLARLLERSRAHRSLASGSGL